MLHALAQLDRKLGVYLTSRNGESPTDAGSNIPVQTPGGNDLCQALIQIHTYWTAYIKDKTDTGSSEQLDFMQLTAIAKSEDIKKNMATYKTESHMFPHTKRWLDQIKTEREKTPLRCGGADEYTQFDIALKEDIQTLGSLIILCQTLIEYHTEWVGYINGQTGTGDSSWRDDMRDTVIEMSVAIEKIMERHEEESQKFTSTQTWLNHIKPERKKRTCGGFYEFTKFDEALKEDLKTLNFHIVLIEYKKNTDPRDYTVTQQRDYERKTYGHGR